MGNLYIYATKPLQYHDETYLTAKQQPSGVVQYQKPKIKIKINVF